MVDPQLALAVIKLYAADLTETHGYGYEDGIERLRIRELIGHVATVIRATQQAPPAAPPAPSFDAETHQQVMREMGGE